MIRAVIFDMDGVIADTERLHARVESEVLRAHGVVLSPAAITAGWAGTSDGGAAALIDGLRRAGLRLAVASASPRHFIEVVLARLALARFFDTVVSGDDVERGKPDPAIFLLAAERLGALGPSRILALGRSG